MKVRATVAVLGAGYMGSAATFPLAENGADVRLWGTWLDDEIIETSKRGPHPKLKKKLHSSVKLFRSGALEEVVNGVQYIIFATSSDGFIPVFLRLKPYLTSGQTVISMTKGFTVSDGLVETQSEAVARILKGSVNESTILYGAIGGPVKALELSNHVTSGTVVAGIGTPFDEYAGIAQSSYYLVRRSEDVRGLELTAALKNVYSMALGICDGLYAPTMGTLYHNLPALLFSASTEEMAVIVGRAGGSRETVNGLAGVGDLHVTSRSGKNQEFGALVGAGGNPEKVYQAMYADGRQAEGYLALRAATVWIHTNFPDIEDQLPLLKALHSVMFAGADPEHALNDCFDSQHRLD